MSAFMRIGSAISKAYKEGKKAPPKETAPPRQQRRAEPMTPKSGIGGAAESVQRRTPSISPRAKANQAANMLGVPGANSARKLRDKTRRALEEMGE